MVRAEDIIKAGSAAVLVWGLLPEDGSPSTFIHRCFSREGWRESSMQGRLELCAGVLAWPLVMPAVIGFFTWHNGAWVKQKTGKGLLRQIAEQFQLAATHSLLPPWYYIFELYEDGKRRRAGEYLNRFETKRFMYPFLRAHNGGLPVPAQRSTVYLSDKALFADRCGEHGRAAGFDDVLGSHHAVSPSTPARTHMTAGSGATPVDASGGFCQLTGRPATAGACGA